MHCQVCASCGNKSLSSSWITSCFSCYLARMCIIHNEHKPCPCVTWWIDTPWYLMENILSIQLATIICFINISVIDRSNKSKWNRLRWNMFLSLLCYFIIIWCDYLMVFYMFHGPFSLYQVNPSVNYLLDAWLGYRCKLIPQICVVHLNEQYSHGCDSLIGVLFWCISHFVLQWNPSGKARNVSLKLRNLVHFHAQFFINHVYFTPHDRPPLLKGHFGLPL